MQVKGILNVEYLVTGKEMKLLDQNTSKCFMVPEMVLMEQASGAFVQELFRIKKEINRVLVVCGSGNNGADGIAIARLLNQQNICCDIYLVGQMQQESELHKLQMKIYQSYHYPVVEQLTDSYDVVIDAIFGIGLSRTIEGSAYDVIGQMNSLCHAYKVAVDISSGVSADTGEILGTAFLADATITFSFAKLGHYLYPGCEYSGKIIVSPIGITMDSFLDKKPRIAAYTENDFHLLPARKANSNKGTYGKLLIIAGSDQMAGAAYLAAKAAYRLGCGMVKVLTHEANRNVLLERLPELLVSTYGKTIDKKKIIEELSWADAVVIGPGIGTQECARTLLELTLANVAVPFLLDADALNIIAEDTGVLLRPHTDCVITPHLGEMSRLTGSAISYIKSHLIATACDFSDQYNVVCTLKDFRTVTASPYGISYLNLSGNHGMATAGSGDVLSGMIGSLLAQGMSAAKAASFGAYLHGLCGDLVREELGTISLMANDLCDGIKILSKKLDQ